MYLESSLRPLVLLLILFAAAFRLQARRWFAGRGFLQALVDRHGRLDLALVHFVFYRI